MELLRTSYKPMPGKALSYPIQAQQISYLLRDVPMYDELSLCFSKECGLGLGVRVPGCSTRYLKKPSHELLKFKELLNLGYGPLGWQIWVHAVGRERKYLANKALAECGLVKLKTWLFEEKSETWYEGRRVLQVGANEEIDELCFLETHNDGIISKEIMPFDNGRISKPNE